MGLFDKVSKIKEAATTAAAEKAIDSKQAELEQLKAEIDEKKKVLVDLDDAMDMFEYGLYSPKYDFENVEEYKDRLAQFRDKQKQLLKKIDEDAKNTTWTVNNSRAEGRKMVRDISKLIMRAYNGECDEIVRKVSTRNIDSSIEKTKTLAASISKMGRVIGINVPDNYVRLKQEEIRIAYEYAMKKEEEKERIRELREQEREAAKVLREIEAEKKKLEKEKQHWAQAIADVQNRIEQASGDEKAALEAKLLELQADLADTEKAIEDVDYRAANQRAGYVYVISNIGAFGEDVYKIGMTRRLDPMDRVRELGDASVPFTFDVHALIFTEDAPGLETALHHRFESRRLNKINNRREFFRVSLDEIKECVRENFDGTAEFFEVPDATEYRESLVLEGNKEDKSL